MDLNEWALWMTIIGAVFTVIASITAIIGIYTWLIGNYYKKNPFRFDYANYDDVTANVPMIHVHFTNRLNRTITIKRSELMTKKMYNLSESNGELVNNITHAYRTHQTVFEPKPVTFMESASISFKLHSPDPREVRKIMVEAKNLMLITTSGEWYIPIKNIRNQTHEQRDIKYSDVAYCRLGMWWNYLRYKCWKLLLSKKSQGKHVKLK